MSSRTDVLAADFDPWADEHYDDPVAVYEEMRRVDPVHWNAKRGLWFLTRYDDVMRVLKDRDNFSGAAWQATRPHMENAAKNQSREFTGGTMLTTEPPDHTRLRRPAQPHFSPKAMKNLEGRLVETADRLLDQVADAEEWDAIGDFAYPYPMLAMAAVLGIEGDELDELMHLLRADKALLAIDPRASQEVLDEYTSKGHIMDEFVKRLVGLKRAQGPTDDLLGTLIREQEEGRYSERELLATTHLMLEAGHVTTVNLIGNGLKLLLDERSRYEQLRTSPELITAAVEECLRLEGPVHFAGRIALTDHEIDGKTIHKDDVVMLLFPAANRDPEQFERPHEFVIDRPNNRPTGFGAGLHLCIGANLARAEAAASFLRIADRFPDLQLVSEPPRQPTFELRGFRELRVSAR